MRALSMLVAAACAAVALAGCGGGDSNSGKSGASRTTASTTTATPTANPKQEAATADKCLNKTIPAKQLKPTKGDYAVKGTFASLTDVYLIFTDSPARAKLNYNTLKGVVPRRKIIGNNVVAYSGKPKADEEKAANDCLAQATG
jgi:hypothetical protein